MKKDGMYKINTLFHVILISTFFYLFPPQVFSLNEDTSQLDTLLFRSVSEERKGFINEIEEAVKNEKKHIQEILDSQTDRASRNLIIIAGAIIIPVSLFLLLWILKFLFNISSVYRYQELVPFQRGLKMQISIKRKLLKKQISQKGNL